MRLQAVSHGFAPADTLADLVEQMRAVFEAQRIERFAFDVELIKRVRRAGGSVVEAPVAWHGGRRSSLRVLRDAPRMLWDLLRI